MRLELIYFPLPTSFFVGFHVIYASSATIKQTISLRLWFEGNSDLNEIRRKKEEALSESAGRGSKIEENTCSDE